MVQDKWNTWLLPVAVVAVSVLRVRTVVVAAAVRAAFSQVR
jgi:hypothetical protein